MILSILTKDTVFGKDKFSTLNQYQNIKSKMIQIPKLNENNYNICLSQSFINDFFKLDKKTGE